MSDIKSLAHSKWNCKYHIVFAPKYRRQIIYGKLKGEIGKILRKCVSKKKWRLSVQKHVRIIFICW